MAAARDPYLGHRPAETENGAHESDDSAPGSGDEETPLRDATSGGIVASAMPQKTSCELCKARKVKCDRAEPSCSWCAKHNRPCVYKKRRRGHGSPANRVMELEAKVSRLDALLLSLGRRVEEHISSDHASPYTASRSDLSAQSDAPTSRLSGLTPASTATTTQEVFPQASEFPSQDVLYTLVDLYFKHINTWCPILDRKTTFGAFFGATSLAEGDRIILHSIVASTLRFLPGDRLGPDAKAFFHDQSARKVELYALEHPDVDALRALVILSLDSLGVSNGPRSWNLVALICQNARQLGLLTENRVYLHPATGVSPLAVLSRPESWIEDEGRRRLCWMVYLLDRYATLAKPGLPEFLLGDHEVNRHSPCSYDLFSKNVPVETKSNAGRENLGSFSYLCEMLRIMSRICQFLRQPLDVSSPAAVYAWRSSFRSLDGELAVWLQSLPSEYSHTSALCHSDPASRVANWFMLHSVYITAVVRLHSAAAYPAIPSVLAGDGASLFAPSYHAAQRCLAAVESLCDITRDILEANGLDLLGPPFACSLWVAARLLIVHAAATGVLLDQKIDFLIDVLAQIGSYWEVASRYSGILHRVVRLVRDQETSFGAMRNCAYQLVRLRASLRNSTMETMLTRTTSITELDCIEVFDFFNVPFIAPEPSHTNITSCFGEGGLDGPSLLSSTMPHSETDWLAYPA